MAHICQWNKLIPSLTKWVSDNNPIDCDAVSGGNNKEGYVVEGGKNLI
jgi:hypothetical protein